MLIAIILVAVIGYVVIQFLAMIWALWLAWRTRPSGPRPVIISDSLPDSYPAHTTASLGRTRRWVRRARHL